ncbi:hypothetical protein [Streptomonospora wellingtoniae]|uniref:Glycerophosphoryl diester phosphodiesterase membrane domain-containing protein n=1 Tax=Streptomonospora wellingtoniae TaxID=3075544 RepID=A0ABU2KQN9_9ACTN|nr:hypothetical protein [Streptomonospora sp. DSM 45055]MDT0301607.1 hypothetical protein [Streptomonospora sp. DSM 45055]
MSHDDGRHWRAPGSEPGSGQPREAAGGPHPGGWWAPIGEDAPPSSGGGWSAPGGSGGAPPGYGQGGQAPPGHGTAPPPGLGRPWAPRPGVVALRPMNLGDVFNGAFGYIRQNPKATLGLALIVTAVFSIVTSIGVGGYLSDYGTIMQETLEDPYGPTANDPMPFELWSIAAMYGGALLGYVGQILLTGLLAAVVGLAVLGRRLSMREALQVARGRMPTLFGVALLLVLLSLLWTALVVGLVVGAVLLGAAVHPAAGVAVGVLGMPALFVLAVWVYVRTSLAMPVAVLERVGPATALARSWRVTNRSWWRVFGILLLAQLLVGFVVNLLSTPFTGVAAVLSFLAPDAAWVPVAATALAYIGTVLAGALGTPFIIGVTTLLYVDLRMRREGLDLRLQAAAQSGEQVDADVYVPDEAAPGAPALAHPRPGAYGGPVSGGYPPPGGAYYGPGSAPYGGAQPGPPQGGYAAEGYGWGGSGHGGPGTSA